MKKLPISLLCGIAVILLTVILFFTILGNTVLEAIHLISLVAIVLAEIVTTVYAVCAKANPRGVAAAVVSSFMIPASLVLSVVYIANFPIGYGAYLGWYCAGTVLVNALALILLGFDGRKSEENAQFQTAKDNMLHLRKLVKCVMAEPAAKPFEARLRALEEALHFSNDSVIVPVDETICQLLLQLQQNISDPDFDAQAHLEKLEKTVQTRTIMTSKTV